MSTNASLEPTTAVSANPALIPMGRFTVFAPLVIKGSDKHAQVQRYHLLPALLSVIALFLGFACVAWIRECLCL